MSTIFDLTEPKEQFYNVQENPQGNDSQKLSARLRGTSCRLSCYVGRAYCRTFPQAAFGVALFGAFFYVSMAFTECSPTTCFLVTHERFIFWTLESTPVVSQLERLMTWTGQARRVTLQGAEIFGTTVME